MNPTHRRAVRACLGLASGLLLAGAQALAADEGIQVPWHGDGTARQVVGVLSGLPRHEPVVDFNSAAPGGAGLRIVTPEHRDRPLPYYRQGRKVSVVLPGDLAPGLWLLVAYSGGTPGGTLPERPHDGDDYAQTTYGDAWDFDEGDQEGIVHWGDRPSEYGKVTVKDGRLVIPVTGGDPYFIWGVMFGDPGKRPVERIDSKLYRYLQIRLRQSCPRASWSVYATDSAGRYEGYDFEVSGTGDQDVTIDLREAFPEFWDGREMRALRIDPTNGSPGCTVEIDSVRLLRPAPWARVGPLLTRAQVEARAAARTLEVQVAGSATVGAPLTITASALAQEGRPLPHAPLAIGVEFPDGREDDRVLDAGASGTAQLSMQVATAAGTARWVAGVSDDIGEPRVGVTRGTIDVRPGPLDHYKLACDRRLVSVDRREVAVEVWGADRYGNRLPCDIASPRWQVTGGAQVAGGRLSGSPARVTVLCAGAPLVNHDITLLDEQGRTGTLELMTMAVNENRVKVGPNGYLVNPDGSLFLPLGGFYANWPTARPDASGVCRRALDLFPCGPVPYTAGYPWDAEVESQVSDFLQFAHENGVTALRLMLRNMDLVGRADEEQLQAVLHLLDLARPLGIRFDVVLFEDYDKPPYVNGDVLERVVLPHYAPADLKQLPAHRARFLVGKRVLDPPAARYTDRDAIACQKDYLDELLPRLAPRDEVFCYELENEMVRPPMSWVNEITAHIRSIDPFTPVLGNPGPHAWPEPLRWHDSTVDLFSYHPYSDGRTDADHGAVAFMQSKWAAAAGKPFFSGEGGINQNRWQSDVSDVQAEFAARGIRDQIWLSLCCGACGAFMWTPQHASEPAEFGKVGPALAAVGIDLRAMQRPRPRVAVVMPDGDNANGAAYALGWKLLGLGVDFDTVGRNDAAGYEVQIAPDGGASIDALRAEFRPGPGYQLAHLTSADRSQSLVYLRNVAGGIVNVGEGRPCYLRRPAQADAAVTLAPGARWRVISAFDLDEGRKVPIKPSGDGATIVVTGDRTHDYVLGFRR